MRKFLASTLLLTAFLAASCQEAKSPDAETEPADTKPTAEWVKCAKDGETHETLVGFGSDAQAFLDQEPPNAQRFSTTIIKEGEAVTINRFGGKCYFIVQVEEPTTPENT